MIYTFHTIEYTDCTKCVRCIYGKRRCVNDITLKWTKSGTVRPINTSVFTKNTK